MAKREEVDAALLKVLYVIYITTKCSNGVFQYVTLHWTQARIAERHPDLVEYEDGVVKVDGDGFTDWDSKGRERVGRGYRLTKKGLSAIAAHLAAKEKGDAA